MGGGLHIILKYKGFLGVGGGVEFAPLIGVKGETWGGALSQPPKRMRNQKVTLDTGGPNTKYKYKTE